MSTTVAQIEKHTRKSLSETGARRSFGNRTAWGYALALLAIVLGVKVSEGYYLTAESGVGYALGIIGGSLMLALLLYPLRKRYRVMRFLGPVSYWFKAHMFLGVLGPILILYHSNFKMGSTNSSVALVCMTLVAGSGVIGRYLYSKIHNGLYGRRLSLEELRGAASQAQTVGGTSMRLLPELMTELQNLEHRLIEPRNHLLMLFNPLLAGIRARVMHWRFGRKATRLLRELGEQQPLVATHAPKLRIAAMNYGERRLQAARQVAQFHLFERLFSLWHILHFPLFLMMIFTAIVHVVAVHMY